MTPIVMIFLRCFASRPFGRKLAGRDRTRNPTRIDIMIEVTIRGAVCGSLWMPGVHATKYLTESVTDQRDRFSEPGATLRECLLSILMREGGDFQSATFTADTKIVVTHTTATTNDLRYGAATRIIRERIWPIQSFPSVSDLVTDDVFSWDGCD